MSYYRYITGIYKSYWPELNRTLRSSSVPRTVPEPGRYVRGTSMPPGAYYTDSPSHYVTSTFYSAQRAAASGRGTPFADRANSVPPRIDYSHRRSSSPSSPSSPNTSSSSSGFYSDFDCKVMSYSAELDRRETTRRAVSSRAYSSGTSSSSSSCYSRNYPADSYRARYDYYDGNKHGSDGLYPCSTDMLGTWKHSGLSSSTLASRNSRARSPLVTRELDRYFETSKRANYIGDISSGGSADFRHYNYRRVPYFGGSDNYTYMKQKPTSWGGARSRF